ncbi:MAG: homoaconitase [Planctomycetota bacterium]|nr:homoaconitase [Planctomycetota bacterium]
MGQAVVEIIAGNHLSDGPSGRSVRSGDFVSIRPRHVMTHDNTAPVLKKFRSIGATRIHDPHQPVFTLDHDIQNRTEANLAKYRAIEDFAREQGVDFYPAGEGIGHQIMVERGYVVPGSFVVASDSHSNMYGALGAIGTPVVRTDAAAIWATGEFWWQIPRTVRVVLEGELLPGATGKDVIITLCGLYNRGEVLNAAVEFGGPGVASLDMDARFTISNMTTEWGALVGWFPPDEITRSWLRWRREVLAPLDVDRPNEADLGRDARPDPDASYAARITLDLAQVTPHVSGPDSVQVMTSLAEMEERSVAIQKAYLVSCVNSRFDDIVAAANVLRGRRVADGVELYVAAASREVQERAASDGSWQTLIDAGARPLPPGCGPCIGLGAGLLEPGEVGISATNRNFKGRMGSRDAECYLASPEVVAASAVAGRICGPREWPRGSPERRIEVFEPPTAGLSGSVDAVDTVHILDGFPERVRGRLVLLPPDDINTDGIYGKDYTYRDDMTPEDMARVAFENYDPELAGMVGAGDVIVGGFNFGTGSSREQAVTCLKAKRIALVIAGSYSQTYLRNAFNNGFLCLECPELVAHLRERLADDVAAGKRTIIPGDELEVDFKAGTVSLGDRSFRFPPMSEVPQSLVVAGGVENLVRRRLGLS